MCQIAALVKFWPYDLTLTTKNFAFDLMDGGGWSAYGNSIRLAHLTALTALKQMDPEFESVASSLKQPHPGVAITSCTSNGAPEKSVDALVVFFSVACLCVEGVSWEPPSDRYRPRSASHVFIMAISPSWALITSSASLRTCGSLPCASTTFAMSIAPW